MVKKLRGMGEVLYRAAAELIADDGFVLAASIAFFTIFSLAPLLMLVVALAGFVFGQDQTRAEIQGQFGSLMGSDSAEFIAGVISRASKGGSGFAAVVSIGTLLFGATGAFAVSRLGIRDSQQELMSAQRVEATGLEVEWPTRVRVGQIIVSGPRAIVERDQHGNFPLTALLTRAAAAPSAPPAVVRAAGRRGAGAPPAEARLRTNDAGSSAAPCRLSTSTGHARSAPAS